MVRTLGFLGVPTAALAEVTARSRDVLGLEPTVERPMIVPDRGAA